MLTIKIENDYAGALKEMGIKTDGISGVMTIRDGGELLGLGTMRAFEKCISVDKIVIKDSAKDFNLEYGLGKSMLNFIDLKGYRYAVSSNCNMDKLLKALKFKPAAQCAEDMEIIGGDWLYCLNLDGYFTSNC